MPRALDRGCVGAAGGARRERRASHRRQV